MNGVEESIQTETLQKHLKSADDQPLAVADDVDYWTSADAEVASELKPRIEKNSDSLGCFGKPAGVETAETFGPALKQQSYWGSSVAAEIEEKM